MLEELFKVCLKILYFESRESKVQNFYTLTLCKRNFKDSELKVLSTSMIDDRYSSVCKPIWLTWCLFYTFATVVHNLNKHQ